MKPTDEKLEQGVRETVPKIAEDELKRRLEKCTSKLIEKKKLLKKEFENRRIAEDALRKSESRYNGLFENMIDGIAVYEPLNNGEDFVFIDFNKAAEKISAKTKEALIGQSVCKMFPGVKEFGLLDVLRRVWKSGKPERHPMTAYRDDRISHWSENSVYKLPSGKIVAVYSDETERRQAEETLRWELSINSALSDLFEPLISRQASIKDIAKTILDKAITLTGSEHGYVSTIDHNTGDNVGDSLHVSVKDRRHVSKENRRGFFRKGNDGLYPEIWGHSLNSLEAFFTNSPAAHAASARISEGTICIRRILSVPVMLGEELVGRIAIVNKDHDYTERDLTAICRLAESYTLALQRRRFEGALQKAHDELERRVEQRTSDLLKSNTDLKREINERKRVEKELRESGLWMHYIFNSLEETVLVVSPDRKLMNVNDAVKNMFGYTIDELENQSTEMMHVDHEHYVEFGKRIQEAFDKGESANLEFEAKRKNGEIFPTEHTVSLLKNDVGNSIGIVSVLRDLTERKRAENQIHALTQELIKAQENERQRIARDLHDNVAQNLSSLRISCETLFDSVPSIPAEVKEKVSGLSKILQETISSVRDIAYDLRPSSLDQFGLVQTVFQYCEEVSEKYGLHVDFNSAGLDNLKLDFDSEINLYRIIQEALNNARKHAEARHVVIRLAASFPNIILRIEDDGKGFDIQKRLKAAGAEKRMGLRSMEERVKLLGGRMRLQSGPDKGTKILIEIPCKKKGNG